MDLILRVKEFLIERARLGLVVSYGELVDAIDSDRVVFDVGINSKAQFLYKVLTDISEVSFNENGIFLSVLVCSKRSLKPGSGFIKFGLSKKIDFDWKEELKKVFDFYSSKGIKDGSKSVLGIDVGFSRVKDTSSFCILSFDGVNIDLVRKCTKFVFSDFKSLFSEDFLNDIDLITIDAPLTSDRILSRPSSGRDIDKLFSSGLFNNSKRGPQPGSISTPKQGWPLYEAGMDLKEFFDINVFSFFNFDNGFRKKGKLIFEIIPKLTQTLCADYHFFIDRPKKFQIDNYLFPHTFNDGSRFLSAFNGINFSDDLLKEIELFKSNPKYYHEELAGLIAALQGVLFLMDRFCVVGFSGIYQGHFLLPDKMFWDDVWKREFDISCNRKKSVNCSDFFFYSN